MEIFLQFYHHLILSVVSTCNAPNSSWGFYNDRFLKSTITTMMILKGITIIIITTIIIVIRMAMKMPINVGDFIGK